MSFSVRAVGNPPGVFAKVSSNTTVPNTVKKFLEDVLANYEPTVGVALELDGHLNEDPTVKQPWGNVLLKLNIMEKSDA